MPFATQNASLPSVEAWVPTPVPGVGKDNVTPEKASSASMDEASGAIVGYKWVDSRAID